MARNRTHQNTALVAAAYIVYLRARHAGDGRKAALDRYEQLCAALTHNERVRLVAIIRNGAK